MALLTLLTLLAFYISATSGRGSPDPAPPATAPPHFFPYGIDVGDTAMPRDDKLAHLTFPSALRYQGVDYYEGEVCIIIQQLYATVYVA